MAKALQEKIKRALCWSVVDIVFLHTVHFRERWIRLMSLRDF